MTTIRTRIIAAALGLAGLGVLGGSMEASAATVPLGGDQGTPAFVRTVTADPVQGLGAVGGPRLTQAQWDQATGYVAHSGVDGPLEGLGAVGGPNLSQAQWDQVTGYPAHAGTAS